MKKILVFFTLICSALSLMGAKNTYNYTYLMTHLQVLKNEYAHCEKHQEGGQCDVVKRVTHDFVHLLEQRRANPELFGKQILKNQLELVQAENALKRMNKDSAKTAKLQSAYESLQEKVSALMAVITVTSM